jgi:integrase
VTSSSSRRRRAECSPPARRRHVYFTLRQALHDAVVDELIPANPAQVARSEVPPKIDKDPGWRRTAVFAREEVETLISDPRVAEDHRVVYALALLTGARHGEVAALHWRHIDTTAEPLRRLTIEVAYNSASRIEKGVKTDRPRLVTMHPALAKVLASWRLSGWKRAHGRNPGPDDLVIPSPGGGHRTANVTLELFHDDLARLGLRKRRFHDARRTFISLCLGDGASKDMLRWVTHAPGDVFDGYTSPPWAALCEAVGKLCVQLPPEPVGAEVIPLPFAGSRGGGGEAPAMS